MKDIFNINRFWALVVKYYRENMRTNVIFLTVMLVITWFVVNKGSFSVEYVSVPDAQGLENFIRSYKELYASSFKSLLVIFCMAAGFHSLKNYTSSSRCLSALLLPASNFEKYLLSVLHSTLMVGVVFLGIFYATVWVTSTYKYVGVKQWNFETAGWLGGETLMMTEGQELYHTEVGNVFVLSNSPLIKVNQKSFWEKVVMKNFRNADTGINWNMNIIWWTFLISVCMWGAITFRRRAPLITFLIHIALYIGLFVVFVSLGNWLFSGRHGDISLYDLIFVKGHIGAIVTPSANMLLLLYVFVIGYQWVIWKKLQTKQLS